MERNEFRGLNVAGDMFSLYNYFIPNSSLDITVLESPKSFICPSLIAPRIMVNGKATYDKGIVMAYGTSNWIMTTASH